MKISEIFFDNAKPEQIMEDAGGEWADINKWARENDILLQISDNESAGNKSIHYSQGIVERYNRTFRDYSNYYLEQKKRHI